MSLARPCRCCECREYRPIKESSIMSPIFEPIFKPIIGPIFKAVAVALMLVFAVPSVSSAHVPVPTQSQADSQATHELSDWASYFSETYDSTIPDGVVTTPVPGWDGAPDSDDTVWNVTLDSYDLDPCEIGKRNAYCDFTAYMSDGEGCDGTVVVSETRRGRLQRYTDGWDCDGDGGFGISADN